jgi:hypothetical protein
MLQEPSLHSALSHSKDHRSRRLRGFTRGAAGQRGMALLVVLAVVALLSGLVITLLGSASKQVSQSRRSAATTGDADLARLAQSQLLGDILQEIKAGSVEVDSDATTIRYPATPQSAVPDRSSASTGGSSATAPPPNLLKQTRNARPSYDGAAVFAALPVYPQASAYPVPNRASALSSSAGALTGGISNARWNQPLLLPRVTPIPGRTLRPQPRGP